jgi:Lon protease-like protein
MINIPVFPLPVFLLPQGITRLQIFEPRYLNMISIATQNNGFAIVLNAFIGQPKMMASWVDIIDFYTSEQGMLIVDVKCKALVSLTSPYQDEQSLLWASYAPVNHWQTLTHNQLTETFSRLLHSFFSQSEDLSSIYHDEFIDTPNWVMSRWLELLPIAAKDKMFFFEPNSSEQVQSFLGDLLIKETT